MGVCSVQIADAVFRDYVISALEFAGIRCVTEPSGDVFCFCDDNVPHLEDGAAAVILYRRPRYTRSPAYAALSERCRCTAIGRPFLLEDLVRSVTELMGADSPSSGMSVRREEEKILLLRRDDLCMEYGTEIIRFTEREFRLLESLAEHADTPVSRESLLADAWDGMESRGNVVDVYVGYLRKKLEPYLGKGVILAVRGKGYQFSPVGYSLRMR